MTDPVDAPVESKFVFRWISIASALSLAAAVVTIASVWGRRVEKKNVDIKLGAPPLVGTLDWRPTLGILPAIALAVTVLIIGPYLSARLSMRRIVGLSALMGTLFTFAVAASDGFSRILDPVVHPTEYWANLADLPGAGQMLHKFASRPFLRNYSVHLKGHPPGFILLLKGLAAVGLGRPWVAGALSYVGVAMMVGGVLVTVRHVVGETAARRCAPFLVLAPFTMWMGTSADAFFAGVAAVAVALVTLSLECRGRWAFGLAAISGLLFGFLLFLTYAAATFLAVPACVAVSAYRTPLRRRLVLALTAGAGVAAVVAGFASLGFWWIAGLKNTNWFYWNGTAQFRPWRFFAFSNLGALIVAVGPAVLAGLVSLRRTKIWILAGSALVCISFATASQYSKGEVERIWILFYPWLVTAVAVLPARRIWLAAQATLVIVLQVWLISKW